MIVLDTNVVSEPVKPGASEAVRAWLDRQDPETLYLTSTSLAELLVGIGRLPVGKRREGLADALNELLEMLFGRRILPFDTRAAVEYARVVGRMRSTGHGISVGDAQIAAIAATHGFAVATRDTAPFERAGIEVINPWDAD
jgi:predicted nucleic acid-binding protein